MPVDFEVAGEQWERYVYVRDNGHLDFIEKANKCDDFFLGKQWRTEDLRALEKVRRPALTINKMLSTLSNVQGDQIQTRAETSFKPAKPGMEDISTVLEKVFQQIAANNMLEWKETDVFADGAITSRGFFDVRLSFNDNMMGEVHITVPNPRNILIDPDAEEYDPTTWKEVFFTKWLSYNDISALYSEADADWLRTAGANDALLNDYDASQAFNDRFGYGARYWQMSRVAEEIRRNIRVVERQHKKLTKTKFFVDLASGDMREVPEGWNRDKIAAVNEKYRLSVIEKITERIRWTTTAGSVVLHDAWGPYGRFTIVPFFPYFRRGRTMGLAENLLGPQELLNKASSQELHIINTTANSGWKVKSGSLRNMDNDELEQRGAETGLVLELADVNDAEKIQPNPVPTGIDRITFKSEEHIKTISGVTDNALGDDREDVAAKAIRAKRQRGAVHLIPVLDNLNRTRRFLALCILDCIQRFYTEPRVFNIIADQFSMETETVEVNTYDEATGRIVNDLTIGEYDVIITTMPNKDTVEESEFEQALALRELGVAIPDDVLIEHSGLRAKRDIIKRIAASANSPEAQEQAKLATEAQRLEVDQLDAENDRIRADAMLKTANAKRNMIEAQNPGGGADPLELQAEAEQRRHEEVQNELDRQMEREKMEHERKMQAIEAQQQREKMDMDMAAKSQDMQAQQMSHMHDEKMAAQQTQQAQKDQQFESKMAVQTAKQADKDRAAKQKLAATAAKKPTSKK